MNRPSPGLSEDSGRDGKFSVRTGKDDADAAHGLKAGLEKKIFPARRWKSGITPVHDDSRKRWIAGGGGLQFDQP